MSSTGEDEQEYVTALYARLDELRRAVGERLAQTWAEPGGTPQSRSERDASASRDTERLAQLDAVENGLCFGRLDLPGTEEAGERRYVGRLGLLDEDRGHEALLTDWRAPAARPFYTATAFSPEGVHRRRHIKTSGRKVTDVHDEVLDHTAGTALPSADAALLASVTAPRTGQMADIVATIQAEQDETIRADHRRVLVVQGAPGTGKTAVALHRAAYLLYTHRERLAKRVVLVVGPNDTFLRYISEVLPSLGETGVLLTTPGELFPGVVADRAEPAEAAALKGRPEMATMIATAVRDRQRTPDDSRWLGHGGSAPLELHPDTCAAARQVARESELSHNPARRLFARSLIDALTRQLTDRLVADVPGDGNLLGVHDTEALRQELRASPAVWEVIDELWPELSPQGLLEDLFADECQLTSAAPWLTADQRRVLLREPGGWTVADIPLLDEAAEFLGEEDRPAERAAAAAERAERLALAREALETAYGSRSTDADDPEDAEALASYDLLDAETLAERYVESEVRSPAERAAADRTWAFGHVVVDEAQEMSPMVWRLLMRRCPARSMTLVGDIAQTGSANGASTWDEVLAPYVPDRWRLAELTVNYRLPAEIADVAGTVLAAIDPALRTPLAVRHAGHAPWRREVSEEELVQAVASAARQEARGLGAGRLAILTPRACPEGLRRAVAAAVPDAARLDVLPVERAKGLEFDRVIVVEPGLMVAESERGMSDLYVALTRATQRLGVLHSGALPPVLSGLLTPG